MSHGSTSVELSRVRLGEAKALLESELSDGAFYLAGYAVECALKACIAKNTRAHSFPPRVELVQEMYTHSLPKLLKAAGLDRKLKDHAPPGSDLDKNWSAVYTWSEKARYERKTLREAQELYKAITEPHNGVLPWLQQNW